MFDNEKIVEFIIYCPKCEFKDTVETEEPCNECLTSPVNIDSQKPVNFKEKGVK